MFCKYLPCDHFLIVLVNTYCTFHNERNDPLHQYGKYHIQHNDTGFCLRHRINCTLGRYTTIIHSTNNYNIFKQTLIYKFSKCCYLVKSTLKQTTADILKVSILKNYYARSSNWILIISAYDHLEFSFIKIIYKCTPTLTSNESEFTFNM